MRRMKGNNEWKKWYGKWMKNLKGKNEWENEKKNKRMKYWEKWMENVMEGWGVGWYEK